VCYQNKEAKVIIHINNAECKKMVRATQLKLHRTITASAIDMKGEKKEWKD